MGSKAAARLVPAQGEVPDRRRQRAHRQPELDDRPALTRGEFRRSKVKASQIEGDGVPRPVRSSGPSFSGARRMVARFGEGRRRAFLKAYAQSGNVTLSAEQAGVSRSWVSLSRRSDPGFDAQCRAAKAVSAERLAGAESNRPPPGWEQRRGAALALTRAGKVVRSPSRSRWTPRAEARFLGKLRQCNNLKLACERAGMTLSSYEAHRRRWPGFRRRVSEARAFAGLWLTVAREAERERPFDFGDPDELDTPPLSIDELIRMVRRYKRG
jgi:hypothetical protein